MAISRLRFSVMPEYVQCRACFHEMKGIVDIEAREVCHECGGVALIGSDSDHQERVALARKRLAAYFAPIYRPSTDGLPPLAA